MWMYFHNCGVLRGPSIICFFNYILLIIQFVPNQTGHKVMNYEGGGLLLFRIGKVASFYYSKDGFPSTVLGAQRAK